MMTNIDMIEALLENVFNIMFGLINEEMILARYKLLLPNKKMD